MSSVLVYAIYLFARVLTSALMFRAILSWFAQGQSGMLSKIYYVIVTFTEPIVSPCRKLLSRFNTGMIDFSVLIAMLLVQFVANFLVRLVYFIF